MRPSRPDIAVPPFPPATAWIGEAPPAVEKLSARGPVLVHFFEIGHLSSVRTVPYLISWHDLYAALGLTVLGINSPRFPFTAQPAKLAAALDRLGVSFPVAADPDYVVWRAYGCEGWPSTFLWARGGVLDWFHFGEGEYEATEVAIRAGLGEDVAGRLPAPVEPLRPSDARDARVIPPSEEVFPGGDASRPWRPADGAAPIELAYEGAGAAVTLDGEGTLEVRIDDEPERTVEVAAPGLYGLSEHARHGSHRLSMRASAGVEVYCIAFAPGVP